MKRNTIMMFLILCVSHNVTYAKEDKSIIEKYSYSLGYKIGENINNKYSETDKKSFIEGMKAAINGKPSSMTDAEMIQSIQNFTIHKNQARTKSVTAFISNYKKRKDVKSLSDGMYYRVIKSGEGASPKATSTVEVHYRGSLLNGKEFDSSYKHGKPAQFPLNRVIKGWTISVQKMKPGDKWEILIPSELAYGSRGAPGGKIGPNETLLFEIELLKVL